MRIGLTGVIGSGKSTVGRVFQLLGAPLYDCDSRAKALMLTTLRDELTLLFGSMAYTHSGELNREHIAGQIFNNAHLKAELEAIVHPAVHTDIKEWVKINNKAPYVLIESAILIGNIIQSNIDKLLVVHAPMPEIIERITIRDRCSEAQAKQRIESQIPQEQTLEAADFAIYNPTNELLLPKIIALHEKLLPL